MAIFDFECRCGHSWEAITGVIHDPNADRCPKCGEINPKRLMGSLAQTTMLDYKNMEPGEINMALRHKKDIERGVAKGEMDFKPGKVREFEPVIPRRLY